MPYSKYSSDRAPGWEHIPLYPKGFVAIRIVQLVVAILIAGVSAFAVHMSPFDGDIFILSVAVGTLITSTYHLVARFSTPEVYNYWAILALDIFLLVFWLASSGVLASQIIWLSSYVDVIPDHDNSPNNDYGNSYYSNYGYGALPTSVSSRWGSISARRYDDGLGSLDRDVDAAMVSLMLPICVIAATTLGGSEFILHIISLTIHSVFLHRHRAAGLHSKPVNSSSSSSESGTALVPPSAAAIHNKKRPFQLHSTPIPVLQNHNQSQQPSVPSPTLAYTPASGNQPYLKQQPYLSPEQPQNQQRQYQAYQPFQGHQAQGQGQGSIHSPISPQTTGGTTYTQFQRSLAVSPIPAPTPPVPRTKQR